MIHTIKITEPYAEAVYDGRKTFEVRRNDRGYNAGDSVRFIVIKDGLIAINHPLNDMEYTITYVHSGLGLEKEYVAFGIKRNKEKPPTAATEGGDVIPNFICSHSESGKEEPPTAATEGGNVIENYLRYLFGSEFGKD